MGRIVRDDVVHGAGTQPSFDTRDLDVRTSLNLREAGVDGADFSGGAGSDGVISPTDALDALFAVFGNSERDGSFDSPASPSQPRPTPTGSDIPTTAGDLLETLRSGSENAGLRQVSAGPANDPAEPVDPAETSESASASKWSPSQPSPLEQRATQAQHSRALEIYQAQGFTDINLAKNTPYFNQADLKWKDHAFPKSPPESDVIRTLEKSGCAPTALAMADAALRGSPTRPEIVADFAVRTGTSGPNPGFGADAHGMGRAWAAENNLTYTPARSEVMAKNVDIIRDGIKAGGVAIIGVGIDRDQGKGHFTQKAHIMLVNGYARDDKGREWFFIVDPGRRNQARSPHPLKVDENVVQDERLHNGAGQLRISREQLTKELRHGYVLGQSP